MAFSGWWLNCYCVVSRRYWSPRMQAACLLQCPGCIYTGLGSIPFLLEIWKGDHFAEFQAVAFKQAEKLILSIFNLWNFWWKRFQNSFKPGQWFSHKRDSFFFFFNRDSYPKKNFKQCKEQLLQQCLLETFPMNWGIVDYCGIVNTLEQLKKKLGSFIVELFC